MRDNNSKKSGGITIFDVAREAGVSYSTVSRALNGFEAVRESTRQRVLEAAERLGYVANLQARGLAGGRSQIIAVLVPGLDNGYVNEIVQSIDEELERASYDLIVCTTHRYYGRESSSTYLNTITNRLTDGLIIVAPVLTASYLETLKDRRLPYVVVDPSNTWSGNYVIEATNWQGAYDATKYLIQLGHKRIAFITGRTFILSATDRLEGYKAAMSEHGLPVDEALLAEAEFTHSTGYVAAKKLLDQPCPPTAIFAANDLSAFGAMEAIRERGLSIPDDISIVGFDNIPQTLLVQPNLTTIEQPLGQMGRVGAQLLLEAIQNPQHSPRRVTLDTQLIVRESARRLDPGT